MVTIPKLKDFISKNLKLFLESNSLNSLGE